MSRWRWFRSGWDTAISLPPRIFIRIWTTLPRFLQQKQCWTGLEWVQIRKMTLKKVWFLSRTGRFLSCYEIVKLKNSAFCIKKRYRALKKYVVPLIGGASEIWTLAALQTPYRISSVVCYSVFGSFFRNLPEPAGRQFRCTSQKILSKSVQINAVTCGFEPNLALLQAMKKVENSGSFGPVSAHFEDVGENFGENEKARFSA